MALYFPPLFCGRGSTLKVIKNLDVEFENGDETSFVIGEICIVDEIIGSGFNIKPRTSDRVFRIMNSEMSTYFDIEDKVEVKFDTDAFGYAEKDGDVIELQADFEIKGVVRITKGQKFLHYVDATVNKEYHDLYTLVNNEKVLRMKSSEFEEYFSV